MQAMPSIHLRSRSLLYLAFLAILLYLWSYFFKLSDIHLNPYRSSYVNFKHLLIGLYLGQHVACRMCQFNCH